MSLTNSEMENFFTAEITLVTDSRVERQMDKFSPDRIVTARDVKMLKNQAEYWVKNGIEVDDRWAILKMIAVKRVKWLKTADVAE